MGLKPSERRALREQKLSGAVQEDTENKKTDKKPKKEKPERQRSKWSEFVSEHTMLITFIICMAILFAFISPYNVFYIAEKITENINTVDDGEYLTLENVRGLSEKKMQLVWEDLEPYNYINQSYKTKSGGKYIRREYAVAYTGYVLLVGGKTDDGPPDYAYLIDYSYTGDLIDIRKKDVEEFIKKIEQIRKTGVE